MFKNKINSKKENHNEININADNHDHSNIFIKIYDELVKINKSISRLHNKLNDHEQRISKLENGGRG